MTAQLVIQLTAVQTATAVVRRLLSNSSLSITHITGPQVTPKATANTLMAISAVMPASRLKLTSPPLAVAVEKHAASVPSAIAINPRTCEEHRPPTDPVDDHDRHDRRGDADQDGDDADGE